MHVEVFVDGKSYVGSEIEDELEQEELLKTITDSLKSPSVFKMFMDSGVLVLGSEVSQKAHYVIVE